MKLLLDQNISHKILKDINQEFPKSNHVYKINMHLSSDQDIWDYAQKNDFVIVTQDSDFHERSLIYGYPPKILWLRTGNTSTENIKNLLLKNSQKIKVFYTNKELSCFIIY